MAGTIDRLLPSPFLKASAAFHVIALAGLWVAPGTWPLWLAAFVADHLVLSTVGLVPRGTLLGPNVTRLPATAAARREIAITIDDGPDPDVTPEVLRILAEHGARATFFCIGTRLREHPELGRRMLAGGHDVENHTRSHPYTFSFYGPARLRREVQGGQQDIAEVLGRAPVFFRAPAGLRNPLLQPVLAAAGVRLVSWSRRAFDTVEGRPQVVRDRLTRKLAAGEILVMHDGRAARTPDGRPVILATLPAVLEAIRAAGFETVTLRKAFASGAEARA